MYLCMFVCMHACMYVCIYLCRYGCGEHIPSLNFPSVWGQGGGEIRILKGWGESMGERVVVGGGKNGVV